MRQSALSKERLAAFMDAVVAIIMTILVLELERPETVTWAALWDMRMSFVAYAVSFFGIAVMWTTWHRDWHDVTSISDSTVWTGIAVLFVMSLVPFTTSLVVKGFSNVVAQTMYGLVTMFLILANSAFYRSLSRVGNNADAADRLRSHSHLLLVNAMVMLAFALLGLAVAPEMASVGILVSSLVYVLPLGGGHAAREER